jgi:hypothetical protein
MPRTQFENQPDPNADCDDPLHDEDCTCGARPDHEYEKRVEKRMSEQ